MPRSPAFVLAVLALAVTYVAAVDVIYETWNRAPLVTPLYTGWSYDGGSSGYYCHPDDDINNNRRRFYSGSQSGRRLRSRQEISKRPGIWKMQVLFDTDVTCTSRGDADEGYIDLTTDQGSGVSTCLGTTSTSEVVRRRWPYDKYNDEWRWHFWRQPAETWCIDVAWAMRFRSPDGGFHSSGDSMVLDDIVFSCPFDVTTLQEPAHSIPVLEDSFAGGSANASVWETPGNLDASDPLAESDDYALLNQAALADRVATMMPVDRHLGLVLRFDVRNPGNDMPGGDDLVLEMDPCYPATACYEPLFVYEGAHGSINGHPAYAPYSDWTPQEFVIPADPSQVVLRWRQAGVDVAQTTDGWGLRDVSLITGIPVAGGAGRALSFGRTWHADYGAVTIESSSVDAWADVIDTITIEAWLSLSANSTMVLRKHGALAGNTDIALDLVNGTVPTLRLRNVLDELQSWSWPVPLIADTWTHVAFVYNATTLDMYRDGVLLDSVAVTWGGSGSAVLNGLPTGMDIGTHRWVGAPTPYTERFYGAIDELRIWSVARDAADIFGWHRQLLPPSERTNMVMYQTFNDVDCDITTDELNSNGNGALWGYADWVMSGAPISSVGQTNPEVEVSVVLNANHATVPSTSGDFVFVIQSLPTMGSLKHPGGAVISSVPTTLAAETVMYTPAASCNPCQDEFSYSVRLASGSSSYGTVESAPSAVPIYVSEDYVPPDIIVTTPPVGSPPREVDQTAQLALVSGAGVAGLFFVGAVIYGWNERRLAIKRDKFRKLHESPLFDEKHAFVHTYALSRATTKRLRARRNRRGFWDMEELILFPRMPVAMAVVETMPTHVADDLARSLVYLAEAAGEATELLTNHVSSEVEAAALLPHDEAVNTVFRGYSIVSKMWSGYVRMGFGLNYLHRALSTPLYDICTRHNGRMEISRERADEDAEKAHLKRADTQVLRTNQYELLSDAQSLLDHICSSAASFPPHFKLVLSTVFQEIDAVLPDHKYSAVGQFVFLRLLCPAIAVPEVYGLLDEAVADDARRLLTLLAKMLQNLSADIEFGEKEEYMVSMNDYIQSNRDKYRRFIETVTTLNDDDYDLLPYRLPKSVRDISRTLVYNYLLEHKDKVQDHLQQQDIVVGTADKLIETYDSVLKKIGPVLDNKVDGSDSDDSSD